MGGCCEREALPRRFEDDLELSPAAQARPWGMPLGIAGRGAKLVVELFMDFDCPFSAKMASVVYNDLQPTLRARKTDIEFLWCVVPQVWHPQSCVMNEIAMALLLYDQKQNTQIFWPCAVAVLKKRDEQFMDMHTAQKSRLALHRELLDIVESATSREVRGGVAELVETCGEEADVGEVTRILNQAAKFQRSRSVHVTPTVYINGFEARDISSGWAADQWLEKFASSIRPQEPWGAPLGLGGRGARLMIELFMDLDCPFSAKMANVIYKDLQPMLREKQMDVEFLFCCVPQPWHPQSCSMTEVAMAMLLYDQKKNTQIFWPCVVAILRKRDEQFMDMHTAHKSRLDLHRELLDIVESAMSKEVRSGVAEDLASCGKEDGVGDVTEMLKLAAEFHRSRHVHVTPTVFINGFEASDISSGWAVDQWLTKLASTRLV